MSSVRLSRAPVIATTAGCLVPGSLTPGIFVSGIFVSGIFVSGIFLLGIDPPPWFTVGAGRWPFDAAVTVTVNAVTSPSTPARAETTVDSVTSRSILVTGGNRGIGLAVVEAFTASGDTVTATHRAGAVLPEVRGPGTVQWVPADVTDTAAVDAAFAAAEGAAGPVEVAVANAGMTRDTLTLRMSDEDWASVLDTNLTGAFRVARRATRSMIRARCGRIVLISSVVGLLGSAGQVNYGASKAGMVGLARSLAREIGPRGVTVNVVAPGFVRTAMTDELGEDRRRQILGAVPLGRLAEPGEVAGVVHWLAGPAGGYVTGALVPVDGGLGMGH